MSEPAPKAVTLRQLKQCRAYAEKRMISAPSTAKIINRLCDEIIRLRGCKKHSDVTEDTLWPWGKHKGVPIHAVPRSYLEWWVGQTDRGHLIQDLSGGEKNPIALAIAGKKLKLLDFLTSTVLPLNGNSPASEADSCGLG